MAERAEHPDVAVAARYFCPASGDVEDPRHGGFDVCCDAPEKHQPVTATEGFTADDLDELRSFIRDERHIGALRSCAYELLDKLELIHQRGVAAGRKLAADAIRAYGIRDEDLPPGRRILLDRDHAAKIAQGDTDG